jgi:hypothetical protein
MRHGHVHRHWHELRDIGPERQMYDRPVVHHQHQRRRCHNHRRALLCLRPRHVHDHEM